jgi:translocation and assembly module TamB
MARRIAWSLVIVVVALVVAAGGAATWLVHTESGLTWLAGRVAGFAGKGLTLDGVSGTLSGGATLAHIRYAGEDIEINVTDAQLAVSPLSLLWMRPRITGLRAAEITVTSKPSEPRGRPPDTLALPVSFELVDARVDRVLFDLGKGPLTLANVRLEYAGGRSAHEIRELTLDALDHAVAVRGSIGATAPFPLTASVTAVRRETPHSVIYASARGTLDRIDLEGGAASGSSRVDATASVKPYDPLPLEALTAKSAALDLHALEPSLPRTALDLDVRLTRSAALYAGAIRMTNSASGPYDQGRLPLAALRAEVRTDGNTARLNDLVADFGAAGTATGGGTFDRDSARLQLQTRRMNLAGLYTRLRETRLAGRADFALTADKQSIVAELTERDLALRITAHRAGDAVDVPQFLARARGGEARGQAHLTLDPEKRFSLDAGLARFDPAAWGDFPAGSINAAIKADGAITGAQVNATFTVRDSRWLGAPLAGRGAVSIAGERLRNADVEATLGGNSIIAKGALGAPGDTLSVRFNAPRLALIDPRLAGSARGNVQLTGAWRAPGVRFDVAATELAHASYGRVKALDARGTLSTRADGPFDVDAALRGVSSAQWQLRAASATLKGTRASHTVAVAATGDRIDFQARASGGWKSGAGWSGTVLELVNRGDAAVSLAGPVQIAVGRARAHASPFELRVVGGTLVVSQLAYERGRVSTAGRFSDLPLKPVMSLAGAAADSAGTLRLTGSWSLTNAPQWLGTVSIARQSGDLALGIDKSIRIGLQTLALDAEFRPQALTLRARLRSALAAANAEGRISPVGGHYTRASPLAFSADVDVARLAPFAALIDTTMLVEGEAHARLQGRGTLGDPQITGPLTAERLAIALPAEGVDLKGGTLKAQLTAREVRVESFSIRGGDGVLSARGTLARAGFSEASVDWTADRFMILNRPDRRLVLSGKGNAALRAAKLAFTGALKANEGAFELATTSLPTLGSDVIVVGRGAPKGAATPPEPARKLPRAIVDISIDLGNNVHVRGHGLDVWLAGEVRVQTNAQGELRAAGTVDARRGTFAAYGQRLEVDHGTLYFNGPLSNPGLDILAMRKRQAVEAGVAVTGTLTRPLVRVVSNPPLPEGEALSWLVLGRAPGTAGAGQLSALPLATAAVMGKAGAPLARALHVDEIGLAGSGGVSEQFLTVGKRITDRLYVMFEQSLGGAENLLRLEFSLTERLGLRAQAGQTSSFGLFYRYGWD